MVLRQSDILLKKVCFFLSLIAVSLSLCACSATNNDGVYGHLLGEEAAQQAYDLANGNTVSGGIEFRTWVSNITLSIAVNLRSMCVIVCFVSMLFGVIGLALFRETMWIKRVCWGLILIVPAFVIGLTYGSAFLANWFL